MPFFDLSASDLAAYRSRAVCPDDFAAFWSETLAEAETFPLDAVFTRLDTGLNLFDVYDLTFTGFRSNAISCSSAGGGRRPHQSAIHHQRRLPPLPRLPLDADRPEMRGTGLHSGSLSPQLEKPCIQSIH
jgi:hypothetical protein